MERGQAGTKDYRVHVLAKDGDEAKTVAELSLWHDVPLAAPGSSGRGSLFNFICEIPKTRRRACSREFKKGDIFFNYGCFPRTWEDPRHVSPDTGYPGDNDPLDVCEIGLRQIQTGEIRAVKVLGVLAMIDDDETDWKIVAIDAADRWASELNDVGDVERLLPGTVSLIREWFRTYKIPDGKPPNKFALGEECKGAAYAHKVIHETHEAWVNLVKTQVGADFGFQLPKVETLRDVDVDTTLVRSLSGNNLAASG
ncbi:inorganic diphosphatase [Aureococcus anophagefferens]|nr:inorganic diphosphatase [Aureococcus anophagefferens]